MNKKGGEKRSGGEEGAAHPEKGRLKARGRGRGPHDLGALHHRKLSGEEARVKGREKGGPREKVRVEVAAPPFIFLSVLQRHSIRTSPHERGEARNSLREGASEMPSPALLQQTLSKKSKGDSGGRKLQGGLLAEQRGKSHKIFLLRKQGGEKGAVRPQRRGEEGKRRKLTRTPPGCSVRKTPLMITKELGKEGTN